MKGMRWGVRRSRSERAAASGKPASKKSKGEKPKVVVGKTKTEGKRVEELSDVQLRRINNRLQMEQQYANLTRQPPGLLQKGAKFASDIAVNVAKTQITNLANDQASKQIKGLLAKKAMRGIPPPPVRALAAPLAINRLG